MAATIIERSGISWKLESDDAKLVYEIPTERVIPIHAHEYRMVIEAGERLGMHHHDLELMLGIWLIFDSTEKDGKHMYPMPDKLRKIFRALAGPHGKTMFEVFKLNRVFA